MWNCREFRLGFAPAVLDSEEDVGRSDVHLRPRILLMQQRVDSSRHRAPGGEAWCPGRRGAFFPV